MKVDFENPPDPQPIIIMNTKTQSDKIEFKLDIFEELCSKSLPSEPRTQELQKSILEILSWVDENLNQVSPDILFQVLELVYQK